MRHSRPFVRNVALVSTILVAVLAVQPASAQTESVVYSFQWGLDGAYPIGGLISDAQGHFYGTTGQGGFGLGTVFQVTRDGVETALYSDFSGWRGWPPNSKLFRDASGNLFGTALQGGHARCNNGWGCGTVFRIASTGAARVLHHFGRNQDGWGPNGSMVADADGNLYGTTVYGGSASVGAAFKINAEGMESVLHSFAWDERDGYSPSSGLVQDKAGHMYGTTRYGGPNRCDAYTCGTVFEITPDGSERVLYSFKGGVDATHPESDLTVDRHGNLYGTAQGGAYGAGAIFMITPSGDERVLYSFRGGVDGSPSRGALVVGTQGKLYGTTTQGGSYGQGTVFELTRAGKKKVLHSFGGYLGDGAEPNADLVIDAQGVLYGTTRRGGTVGVGTVFRITP